MAESLYHRGLGYRHEAVKIFMPAGAAAPVYAPYTEHYPPDTQAISLWLRNRQPRKWRDKHEVEHMGSIEARIAAMTPEERLARLIELQAKAVLMIEGEATEVEEDRTGALP